MEGNTSEEHEEIVICRKIQIFLLMPQNCAHKFQAHSAEAQLRLSSLQCL